jgi:hypothetical protein
MSEHHLLEHTTPYIPPSLMEEILSYLDNVDKLVVYYTTEGQDTIDVMDIACKLNPTEFEQLCERMSPVVFRPMR